MNGKSLILSGALLVLTACGGGDDADNSFLLQDFQEAAVVLGQTDGVTPGSNANSAEPNAIGLSAPFGAPARAGGRRWVPDQGNPRHVVFPGNPEADGTAALYALGQPDLTSRDAEPASATRFTAVDCCVDDGRLFVVDLNNHRVLIWNSLPDAGTPADVVVGQPNFTESSSGTTASKFTTPIRVRVANGRMFVTEFSNNRVLVWNTIPTTNGVPADLVIGQRDFTSNGTDLNDFQFGNPRALWTDGTRLAVGDSRNQRVLWWETIPTVNGQAADFVIGQPDFTTRGSTVDSFHVGGPNDLDAFDGNLYVVDTQNHRVVAFAFPTANFPEANLVLGQSDFARGTPQDDDQDSIEDGNPSRRVFRNPIGIRHIGRRLWVSDQSHHRIVGFDG
ncbi:MAG: hypothetical protein AAGD14_15080 [Planctomycetota bacterium]